MKGTRLIASMCRVGTLQVLILVMVVLAAGCIAPPATVAPSVIPPRELSLVSHMSAGRTFVAQARFDLAEIEFRKALRLAPQLASLYNDLGYVVSAQQRYSEAVGFFEVTLRFSPHDISALTNLASTYFKMGEPEKSIAVYEKLLALNTMGSITEHGASERKGLTALELVDIYRNLSIVNEVLGNSGEAACWSNKAVGLSSDVKQSMQHERLLLSLERTKEANDFMLSVLEVKKDQISPSLMLDLGAAATELGSYDFASQVLTQVELFPNLDLTDDADAQLLLATVMQRRGDDSREQLVSLIEEDATVCDTSIADRRHYWPQSVVDDTAALIRKYCDESRKSIFSPAKLFSR